MKYLIISFILVSMFSCSTGTKSIQDAKEVKRDDKSFTEDFKKSSDLLAKYNTPKPEKPTVKKNAKTKSEKISKKTVKKKKIVQVKPNQKSALPEDYPEKLIKLDKITKDYWDKVKPPYFVGEKIVMDVSYMGVSAGKVMIESKPITTLAGTDVYHLHARVKTASFYRYIYEVDDSLDSFIEKDTWKPLKYSLIQRESKQDIDDVQIYDHEKHKTYFFYRRVTKTKKSKKTSEKYIPKRFQDAFSFIQFMRGVPMKIGSRYTLPIVNKTETLLMKLHIVGKEILKTKLGNREAYAIDVQSQTTGKTFKSDKLKFWFSTDSKRIFLKFKAKVKLGAISGDIEKYIP